MRGAELQDVYSLPERGLQEDEKKLQGIHRRAASEANANITG